MFKQITKCIIAVMVCTLVFPAFVSAHEWEDSICVSNDDGASHKHYYYCADCGEEYYINESCTWKHSYYYYINYGRDGHYNVYECKYCFGEKNVREACSWKKDDRSYSDYNGTKHKVFTYYDCPTCENQKEVITYKKHVFKWNRAGSNFYYGCKYCDNMPSFNGSPLYDYNDTDNITIKKNAKYKYYMYGYNKSRNKVKSIRCSKKKICTAKRKGHKIVIKGKKKGKCKVTVKMKSGARYILKVRVK